jgi:peroxiredoxin
LEELDVTTYAVSVDTKELAQEVVDNNKLTFPMAYAATKADGDMLGSWWSEDRGGYIQPTEFLLGRGGTVLGAMYATGPVGRMGGTRPFTT